MCRVLNQPLGLKMFVFTMIEMKTDVGFGLGTLLFVNHMLLFISFYKLVIDLNNFIL